jgi:branched-chain amino acid transport system substrate-binding protein
MTIWEERRMTTRRSVLLSAAALAGTALAARPTRANEEVRVGVLSPMTGPAARFGAIQQSTLALAVEEVNTAGGIRSLGGAKLRLIFGDTRGEADMGVTETERLITRERVHSLIGAFQSGVGLPSSAVAERYGVPWLNFGTVDRITQRGFRYVFRPHANDTLKARALVEGITSLAAKHGGLKSGVILSENTEWGKSVADKQKTFLEQAGVEIKLLEHYPYAAPDLTSMIVKTRALRPDLVLANSYLGDALLITRLMGEYRLRPTVYAAGGGGHLQPDFISGAGGLAEGVICATAWDPAVGRKVPWIKEVNDRHIARNSVPITEDAACYYQCFQVLVDALERARDLDPKKIRDAIAATDITDTNHKAMFVPCTRLTFDDTGQNPTATAMVVQVQQGKLRLVHPPTAAEPDATPIWPYGRA